MYEGHFCPLCGAASPQALATFQCIRCGTSYRGNFCPVCGLRAGHYYPIYREVSLQESIGKFIHVGGSFFWIGVLITVIMLLAINIGYLVWGIGEVVPGIVEEQCTDCAVTIYILSPFPLKLTSFSEPSWFLAYYFVLVITIISSIVLAILLDGRRLIKDMLASVGKGRLRLSTKSSWAIIGQLFCTYLFFNLAYLFFLGLFDIEASSPTMEDIPLWYALFELANASVYEEIVTRLVFLGIPMFIIALGLGIRGKPLIKELFGGSGRMTPYAWALIILSASIFGLAHILYWDVYKVIPTFFAGLILGYVYVKRGIWASILFHFIVDYYAVSVFVSSEVGHSGVLAILIFAVFVFIAAGFFFFIYYSAKAMRIIGSALGVSSGPSIPAKTEEGKSLEQAQRHVQQFGFTCSRCGFPEARYLEGKFQCLRCGHIQ